MSCDVALDDWNEPVSSESPVPRIAMRRAVVSAAVLTFREPPIVRRPPPVRLLVKT